MPAKSRPGQRAAPIESPNTTSSCALKKNWAPPRFIPANRRSGSSAMAKSKPLVLTILDGWGYSPASEGNAIALAKKPTYDHLLATYPNTLIHTSGPSVGLPEGQMGNSEVGHMNMGAGRVIFMDVTRIDQAIASGDFFQNSALLDL